MKLSFDPPGVADRKYINNYFGNALDDLSFGTVKVSGDHLEHHFAAKYHTTVLHANVTTPTTYTTAEGLLCKNLKWRDLKACPIRVYKLDHQVV